MSGAPVDRLIPSVEEAEIAYQGAAMMRDIWRSFCECPAYRCEGCRSSMAVVEAASVGLDMALSVGRRFDRQRQQAVWQAREDAALVRSVAW